MPLQLLPHVYRYWSSLNRHSPWHCVHRTSGVTRAAHPCSMCWMNWDSTGVSYKLGVPTACSSGSPATLWMCAKRPCLALAAWCLLCTTARCNSGSMMLQARSCRAGWSQKRCACAFWPHSQMMQGGRLRQSALSQQAHSPSNSSRASDWSWSCILSASQKSPR